MSILTFIASLFGCGHMGDPQMLDGPGMEYIDSDYRSVYANALALNWETIEGYPMFAVAHLGKGDDVGEKRDEYVKNAFFTLADEQVAKVRHFDFGGDEWFLVVPRYGYVDVTNTDTNEKTTLIEGEAFTVVCKGNLVVEDYTHGGHRYSPIFDENGRLAVNDAAVDITDYIMKTEQ